MQFSGLLAPTCKYSASITDQALEITCMHAYLSMSDTVFLVLFYNRNEYFHYASMLKFIKINYATKA